MKRNLTVSIDEKSYRHAKIAAARRGQSVSMLVREYFDTLDTDGGEGLDQASAGSQSLVEALGDERLADLDFDIPVFTETVKAMDFS